MSSTEAPTKHTTGKRFPAAVLSHLPTHFESLSHYLTELLLPYPLVFKKRFALCFHFGFLSVV